MFVCKRTRGFALCKNNVGVGEIVPIPEGRAHTCSRFGGEIKTLDFDSLKKETIVGNLIQYFSSFDKLMKEKLVAPLFWLLVIWVGVNLLSEVFDMIGIEVLDNIIDFLNLFFTFIVAFVAIRVVCELAVAIFRINDNLSPDHGVSETAAAAPTPAAAAVVAVAVATAAVSAAHPSSPIPSPSADPP